MTQRLNRIARILWGVLGVNLMVALAKLLYGYRSGSIAIIADGLHSLLDATASVIGLIGIFAARRPPDANHPYGHRKYETFAALGVAAMMFFGCNEIITAAIERVRHPRPLMITNVGFLIMTITIAANLLVVWIERREGKRLQSEFLVSDAAHTRSDVFASALVIMSFVAWRLGLRWTDLAAAAVIVVLMVRAGIGILKGTLSTLSDERRIQPALVESAALEIPGVLEAHNVRSRGPDDDIHLDLHILVDPQTPIAEAHRVGHQVEGRLRERWPGLTDVVVHVEPGLESERARMREGGGLKAEG